MGGGAGGIVAGRLVGVVVRRVGRAGVSRGRRG